MEKRHISTGNQRLRKTNNVPHVTYTRFSETKEVPHVNPWLRLTPTQVIQLPRLNDNCPGSMTQGPMRTAQNPQVTQRSITDKNQWVVTGSVVSGTTDTAPPRGTPTDFLF